VFKQESEQVNISIEIDVEQMDDLSPLIFNFALDFTIKMGQENREELALNRILEFY
jgi:hypothetical protein